MTYVKRLYKKIKKIKKESKQVHAAATSLMVFGCFAVSKCIRCAAYILRCLAPVLFCFVFLNRSKVHSARAEHDSRASTLSFPGLPEHLLYY